MKIAFLVSSDTTAKGTTCQRTNIFKCFESARFGSTYTKLVLWGVWQDSKDVNKKQSFKTKRKKSNVSVINQPHFLFPDALWGQHGAAALSCGKAGEGGGLKPPIRRRLLDSRRYTLGFAFFYFSLLRSFLSRWCLRQKHADDAGWRCGDTKSKGISCDCLCRRHWLSLYFLAAPRLERSVRARLSALRPLSAGTCTFQEDPSRLRGEEHPC